MGESQKRCPESHLKIKLIQLHKRNRLPRTHPPPTAKGDVDRPHHLLLLLGGALDEAFGPKYVGVLPKDALVARQSDRVVSDLSARRDELAVESVAFGGHNLVMAKGDGDADAEAFPDDGLVFFKREKVRLARVVGMIWRLE